MSITSVTREQRNQASATPELIAFLRELTTPQPPTPAPHLQTVTSTPTPAPTFTPAEAAPEAGTWQDRWIHDHRTDAVADRLPPSPPLASLVFHPRVPAVKMIRAEGHWELPPVATTITDRTMVSVNSAVYQAAVNPAPVTPKNVALIGDAWVSVEAKSAWGLPIAASAKEVLAVLRESPVVPAWQTRYAVVPQSQLAKRVVLGPFTGQYEDWELAEAAAKELQEEGYVVEVAEDMETGDADALDFMGTNFPSTRRPMMRAGLASK